MKKNTKTLPEKNTIMNLPLWKNYTGNIYVQKTIPIISNKSFNPLKQPETMLEHYSIPVCYVGSIEYTSNTGFGRRSSDVYTLWDDNRKEA